MMTDAPYDLDELAERARAVMQQDARDYMPELVILRVEDNSTRATHGWILCRKETTLVRCLVAGNWDTSAGVLLWALPPNDPTGFYFAIGAYGNESGDNFSYIPQTITTNQTVNQITVIEGDEPDTPAAGETIIYIDNTKTIYIKDDTGTITQLSAGDILTWTAHQGTGWTTLSNYGDGWGPIREQAATSGTSSTADELISWLGVFL